VTTTIKIGDALPEIIREAGFAAWNRFAAVNDEFVPIHMDADAGRDAGYPGAIGMGFLQWSYVHNMLRAFVAPHGRIVRVACQFRSPTLAGAVVSTGGTVTAIATINGETVVELDVWTRNQDGDDLSPGTATVAFPA